MNSQEYLEWRLRIRQGVREQKTAEAELVRLPDSLIKELRHFAKVEREVAELYANVYRMIEQNRAEKGKGNDVARPDDLERNND